MLDLLEAGHSPAEAIAALRAVDRWVDHRQIGIVDAAGRSAAFTGPESTPGAGHETGPGFVAMGNNLVGAGVIASIADFYRASASEPAFGERLMATVEAGSDAGGDGLHSRTDLRIEMANPTPDEGGNAFKPIIP